MHVNSYGDLRVRCGLHVYDDLQSFSVSENSVSTDQQTSAEESHIRLLLPIDVILVLQGRNSW
jgi:hypothetical protein